MTWLKRLFQAAPSPAKFDPPRFVPTHRHHKGGQYRLLTRGVLEADHSPVAIYDDADGTIWVRSLAEFEDGRFTPLS